jgi:hypothetical protein
MKDYLWLIQVVPMARTVGWVTATSMLEALDRQRRRRAAAVSGEEAPPPVQEKSKGSL